MFWDGDRNQACAILENIVSKCRNTVWNLEGCEARALRESKIADVCYTFRQRNGFEFGTILKGVESDFFHALGNRYRGQFVTSEECSVSYLCHLIRNALILNAFWYDDVSGIFCRTTDDFSGMAILEKIEMQIVYFYVIYVFAVRQHREHTRKKD